MYTGIGASAGIGIGSVVIVKEPSLAYDNVAVSDIAAEKERFNNALEKCIAKTQAMAEDMKTRVGEKEAEILEGHVLLLMDPEMTSQINDKIENEKMCAEAAVEQVCDMYAQMFSSIEDEIPAESNRRLGYQNTTSEDSSEWGRSGSGGCSGRNSSCGGGSDAIYDCRY